MPRACRTSSMKLRSLPRYGVVLGILCLMPIVMSACATKNGVSYVMGELSAMVNASTQRAVAASEAALRDLDINIVSSAATGIDGEVIGRTAQDRRIAIKIQRETDAVSKLSIRVNTFGDEGLSHLIYDKILGHLSSPR